MADQVPIVLGTEVRGSDDFRGEVERVVMDPSGAYAAQAAVRPRHAGGPARLVPVEMLEQGDDGLRLRCTPPEFEEFPEDPEGRAR